MNSISWNCRGMGNLRAVRVLGDLIRSQKPNFLFLSETLTNGVKIKKLCRKFGFADCWSVDCIGRSGGLAIFWTRSVQCKVIDWSSNHIDVCFMKDDNPSWRMTCFYGLPERTRRRESWELIKYLANKSNLPWCIIGDFNDMLYESEKKGRHKHPQFLLDGFRRTIEECELVELDLNGGRYTWEKSRGTREWVRERLDRAFATSSWWHMFPLCKLSVGHTIISDHEPILLNLCSVLSSRKKFRFRFENTWLKEESFHAEVVEYWKKLSPIHFLPKLIEISAFMEK